MTVPAAALLRGLARALVLALVATAPAHAALEAVDDAGTHIVLAAPARRIVTLAPSATELVHAAGAGDRLVATVATSDWPPSARALPRVGDAFAVDLERVVTLAPDLVVTWPYTVPAQVAQLRARHVPVFVVDPRHIADIAQAIVRLGTLAGTDAAAQAAATAFRRRLATLETRHGQAAPLGVFYEIWGSPLYTIGGPHLITEAIALCGGRNVFAGLALPAPNVTVEAVIAAKPEAIVAGTAGAVKPAWLDEWRRFPTIPAVAADAFAVVDADRLHRPGPRFVEGVEGLCTALDGMRRARDGARTSGR